MIKYMLDTNILIYAIKNRPKRIREAFKQHSDYLSMSSVTLGELIYGAERSARITRNLQDIEGLAARMDVISFDYHAATHFGQVRAELSKKGKPIGPYDSMIAGHARALGLILVTSNVREFKRVPGLRVENWTR
jgi:tRNA(fMet)-specific endonuclease VapC